ncbi:MAG TPA: hypothetical protein VGL66_11555 [Caulobacteraceae bacterium]|jgi:hypothetical protein
MLRRVFLLAAVCVFAAPAFAQSEVQEVVVTGSRVPHPGLTSVSPLMTVGSQDVELSESPPEIGLRRTADFAVQQVVVSSDTRDASQRREEIFAMVKGAIERADKEGIQLATGTYVVEPLTLANYRNLPLSGDNRPDTNRTGFLVKTRLGGGVDGKAAIDKIQHFIHDVPPVGRAEMLAADDLELSVVGPDQYRSQIIDLVAADARKTSGQMGADYAVKIAGLDRPVQWTRASLTEVFLYLPYSYVVVPRAK